MLITVALTQLAMTDHIQIYSAQSKKKASVVFSDFKIGKIMLASHLGVDDELSSIDVDPSYARQLLLKEKSELRTGRVPLYVCGCCADLRCGATTVLVEDLGREIRWSEFGRESFGDGPLIQDDYMKRTGPYHFDKIEYYSVINPYTQKQS